MFIVSPSRPRIEVTDAATGRARWSHEVTVGARVELRYRHSVERTPIVEVFRVERDGLRFLEMTFVSQGAGLPTEGYVREGDHFVLRQPRFIGALPLLVSGAAGHRLWVDGTEVDLVAVVGRGGPVRVGVRWARF